MERRRRRKSLLRGRPWLLVGVCAGLFAGWAPAAIADSSGNGENVVPVAPPASNRCAGPGCTDDQDQVKGVLTLLGNGPGCADGGACFWVQADFDGDKARIDDVECCQWFALRDIDRFRSAKNRYLARKVLTGNADNVTSCMDPGEGRADLDVSDRARVGPVGSSC